MLEAPLHSTRPATEEASRKPAAPALPAESWFTTEWRSDAEIAEHLADLNDEQVRAVMSDHDSTFWRGHPNAAATFRAGLTRLMAHSQPRALLAEFLSWIDGWQLPEETARRLWREAVAVVCAEAYIDPAEVASLIRGRRSEDIHATLEAFREARPASSIEAALAQAEQFLVAAGLQMDGTLKERVKSIVVTAWLVRAPEEALELAAGTEAVAIREALHEPLRRLRALDPKAAVHLLKMAAGYQMYPEAVGETAFVAGFTPEEIRDAFNDAPQKTRLRYLNMYASRAAEVAPDILVAMASLFSAEELLPEASGNGLSQYGPNAVIRALAERDPAACERWLAPLDAELRQELLGNVMNFPALFDAPFARFYLDRAESREEVTKHPYEFRRAIRTLGKEDPELALTYLNRLPPEFRADAEKGVWTGRIASLMGEDPKQAMMLVEDAPETLRRDLVALAVAERYESDPEGAVEWMKTVQDPGDRKFLELHLISTRSKEPDYQRLRAMGASKEELRQVFDAFIGDVATVSPTKAAPVVMQLPEGGLREEAIGRLLSAWGKHDPLEAIRWVSTLPKGHSLDAAARSLVRIIPDKPEEALKWAEEIIDPNIRFEAVQELVEAWTAADFRQATRLAESAPVDEPQRQSLLKMLADSPQGRREAKGL